MLSVHWEVDGCRVTEAELEDAMITAILEDVTEQIQNELSDLMCHEHGKKPEVTIKYTGEGVEFACESCCEAFSSEVQAKLEAFLADNESDTPEGPG